MKNHKIKSKALVNIKLNTITDLAGCFLITLGGLMLASVPRIDLTLGGSCIALSGLILMDFNRNGYFGALFLLKKLKLNPNFALGCLGLLCSLFLGGGEMIDIIRRGQVNNLLEPGYMKVLANAVPYTFAAILSFDSMRQKIKHLTERKIILMQLSLFATGHIMISSYGFRAGNSAYEVGLILFNGAMLCIIALILPRPSKA